MNRSSIEKIKSLPVLRTYLRHRFENHFRTATGQNLFLGTFDTWEQAHAHLPKTKPQGYDNADAASMYVERTQTIHYTDYPMLFWMRKMNLEGSSEPFRVFDYGGHIGVSFYAYDRALPLPENLSWTVYDVPAVRAQGQAFANSRQERRITFSAAPCPPPGTNLLFVSGSPQYAPDFFHDLLPMQSMSHEQKPQHVLLNMIPSHPTEGWYTMNNIGTSFCTYRIFQTTELERFFLMAGYQLRDRWINADKVCDLSYSTTNKVSYFGWYFTLEAPKANPPQTKPLT